MNNVCENGGAQKINMRPTQVQSLKLQIHHGGYFVFFPSKVYVRGKIDNIDLEDIDEFSLFELSKIIKKLGYSTWRSLAYRHPKFSLESGLRQLNHDKDVLSLSADVKGFEVVDIYVERLVDVPVLNEDVVFEVPINASGEEVDGKGKKKVTEEDESEEDNMSTDADYSTNSESEQTDIPYESDYDEEWDWSTVLPIEAFEEVKNIGVRDDNFYDNPRAEAEFEGVDLTDSDELNTPPGSDGEEPIIHAFPKFKPPEGNEPIIFQNGQIFSTKTMLKDAVKDYGIQVKKNLVFKKNDKKRVVVNCMKGCPFYMRFSQRVGTPYWQLVCIRTEHACFRTARNRLAKTEWLAKKFLPTLRHSPWMKVKSLIGEAKERWGVKISHEHAYRAKVRALEKLQGASSEQYLNLRNYAEELLRSNPNSTVIIKCDRGPTGPIFERIYVCLEALKAAFAYTCRPLIGLDACFLKGEFGGQLITAVGKDGNNQMFPIAYAVVEAETRDSWAWFIELLLTDLNNISPKYYGFISDQQKGLVPALAAYGDHVEHRLCAKHLYGNWRKKYPGVNMKEAFWAAARATTIPEWQRAMEKLKSMNEASWKDMHDLPPSMWTKSHYREDTQCDLQVNNMCEAFNSVILEYRDKPIISLLEGLKFYLTNRIVQQKNYMKRYKGDICPRVQKSLEKIKRQADGWEPHWHGDDDDYAIFSVVKGTDQYDVNLKEKRCACRKWNMTGIPCCHAVACMWHNSLAPEEFVSAYYKKCTYLATYSYLIFPSNGPKLWPMTEAEPINPPKMRRAPGRPKKQRNRANDEPRDPNRVPRMLSTLSCKNCGQLGHNRRTCKGKTRADREMPKGGNKRLRGNGPSEGEASTTIAARNRGRGSGGRRGRGRGATRSRAAASQESPNVLSQLFDAPQATQ